MAVKFDSKTRENIEKLVEMASQGSQDALWLDEAIKKWGYVRLAGLEGKTHRIFCTRKDLEEGKGVADRTIKGWAKSGMPIARKGGSSVPDVLDVFEVWNWYDSFKLRELEEKLQGDKTSKEYWDIELHKEKVARERRKNEQAEGDLLIASEVSSQLLEVARVFRAKCELIEKQFGPEVGDEIRDMIDDAQAAWQRVVEQQQAERAASGQSGEIESTEATAVDGDDSDS